MGRETVACNQCGRLLEAPGAVRFVTCTRCGAALVVRRTESSTYTEPVAEQTDIIAEEDLVGPPPMPRSVSAATPVDEELSQLQRQNRLNRLENELNRLDLDWNHEIEGYKVASRYGHRYVPTTAGAVLQGIVVAIFGALWTVFAFVITKPDERGFGPPPIVHALFPLFGIVFVIAGVAWCVWAFSKASNYERAYESYARRRTRLLEEIRRIRSDY